MVNRVIRDDPSKGDMHNRQPITPRLLWASLKDYDLWPMYAIGLTFLIPAAPPGTYFTLTLRNLGFSVLVTNLLTVPQTVLNICNLLLITYLSEKWKERALLGLFVQVWKLPFMIYLYVVDITVVNRWMSFAILTLLLGSPTSKSSTLPFPSLTYTPSSSPHPSCMELAQLQHRSSSNRLRRPLQHVRPDGEHFCRQCLPQARCA
jgi:hypothetical protein